MGAECLQLIPQNSKALVIGDYHARYGQQENMLKPIETHINAPAIWLYVVQ